MLSTWGGNNGIDTISQDELDCVGFDTCAEYCKKYCWHYGMNYCPNCGAKMVEKQESEDKKC